MKNHARHDKKNWPHSNISNFESKKTVQEVNFACQRENFSNDRGQRPVGRGAAIIETTLALQTIEARGQRPPGEGGPKQIGPPMDKYGLLCFCENTVFLCELLC